MLLGRSLRHREDDGTSGAELTREAAVTLSNKVDAQIRGHRTRCHLCPHPRPRGRWPRPAPVPRQAISRSVLVRRSSLGCSRVKAGRERCAVGRRFPAGHLQSRPAPSAGRARMTDQNRSGAPRHPLHMPKGELRDLMAIALERIYAEKMSGKEAANLQALTKALASLQQGDVLLVTRLDRLARSTPRFVEHPRHHQQGRSQVQIIG